MLAVLDGTYFPSLESTSYLLHSLPLLGSTTYLIVLIGFVLMSVLLVGLLCPRVIRYSSTLVSCSPGNLVIEKQEPKRTASIPATSPANSMEPFAYRNHLSLLDLENLPVPAIRQYQDPFPNVLRSTQQIVPADNTCVIGAYSETVTRHDMVQDVNGCRRHAIVWG